MKDMKFARKDLTKKIKKLEKLRRRYHHPLIHKVKTAHHMSGRTLYCVKEYGKKSNVSHVIIKESIKILILASVISSVGGVALQTIQQKIFTIMPLLILLPALNDMIGDFGAIVSSKFSEFIYTDRIQGNVWRSKDLHKLFATIQIISLISSLYIGIISFAIAYLRGFGFSFNLLLRIIELSVASTMVMVGIIFFISVSFGMYFCNKREDPNNFLIPISTSIADLGSIAIYSAMIVLFF